MRARSSRRDLLGDKWQLAFEIAKPRVGAVRLRVAAAAPLGV
jgi:hypothetical protein